MPTLAITVLIAALLDPRTPVVVVGKGCGVIVYMRGYVLTCEHVIERGYDGKIVVCGGKAYSAERVSKRDGGEEAEHSRNELLLLRMIGGDGKKLIPVKLAESLPRVGEPVTCVGHPSGFTWTVTKGWLSATGREVEYPGTRLTDLLQLQASINPGNSGGPVFDAKGRMIGLVVAKREGLEGIGFAIPVSQIRTFLKENLP